MVVVVREVRRDPLTGEEVVLSSDRVVEGRPRVASALAPADCPFCPGNEAHTRPTIAAITSDGRWVARAFANRAPALIVEEQLHPVGDGLLGGVSGVGAHEVLVEAPEHAALHTLPVGRTADALRLAVSRLRDLRNDRRLATVVWFRNHGAGAGASQPHPHAQIVGLPIVPRRTRALVAHARAHRERTGRTLLRDVLDAELRDGRRIVTRDGPITALCPYAPRDPFEVWLVPEAPAGGFADASDAEVEALAAVSWTVARALASVLGEVPTTTVALGPPVSPEDGPEVSTAPTPSGDRSGLVFPAERVGWHVRIAPRLTAHAGLEQATGIAVHSVFPEVAARELRRAVERG
ncbi:MAG: DUF4931 domain-containing protein [Myxococcota bacterium]